MVRPQLHRESAMFEPLPRALDLPNAGPARQR